MTDSAEAGHSEGQALKKKITRRDFINGVSIAAAGATISGGYVPECGAEG
jgi:hypothetical protein